MFLIIDLTSPPPPPQQHHYHHYNHHHYPYYVHRHFCRYHFHHSFFTDIPDHMLKGWLFGMASMLSGAMAAVGQAEHW